MGIKITNPGRTHRHRRNGREGTKLMPGVYSVQFCHGRQCQWTVYSGLHLDTKTEDALWKAVKRHCGDFESGEWEPIHEEDARRWIGDDAVDEAYRDGADRRDWARIDVWPKDQDGPIDYEANPKARKRNSVATFNLDELANVGVVLGGLGASRADQLEIWQDLAKFSAATVKASQAQYGTRSGATAYTAAQIRQAGEQHPDAGASVSRAKQSVELFEYNVYDNTGKNHATQWEMQAIRRLEDRMARLSPARKNPRSAPDKYGERTGHHERLSHGQLPSKARFEEIWDDELGPNKPYSWTLKGRDRTVFQHRIPRVRESGVDDAEAMYALLEAIIECQDEREMDLASSIMETLGIECV